MQASRLKDRAIVQAIGVDWSREGYRLSFQYFVPEGSGGQTAFDASKLNNNVATASGPTLTDAIANAEHDQGRQLFFGSNRVIVIGREMAKRDAETPIRFFNSVQQLSPDLTLLVAQGSAWEIVSAQIPRGIVPASAIEQTAERGRTGRFMHGGRLLDTVMQLQSDSGAADLPLISLTGSEEQPQVSISGCALLRGGRLIGTLDQQEVMGLLWMSGGMEHSVLSFPLTGDARCALKILSSSARLRPSIDENGHLLMTIEISVNSALQEVQATDLSRQQLLTPAQREQENEIRRLAMHALEKTAIQNGADVLKLSKALRKYEPGFYRSHQNELPQLWRNMRYEFKIDCNISRMGLEDGEKKR